MTIVKLPCQRYHQTSKIFGILIHHSKPWNHCLARCRTNTNVFLCAAFFHVTNLKNKDQPVRIPLTHFLNYQSHSLTTQTNTLYNWRSLEKYVFRSVTGSYFVHCTALLSSFPSGIGRIGPVRRFRSCAGTVAQFFSDSEKAH
uniref:Uncharacterized protein n=1 Tax=Trypanosoma congolense (strain IL3000) TaxID=1068625 RepID=G0UKM3_TRYCI|nr:hypothetical protein, unlikely [Trypanosoma congolense IL3000]